MIFKTLLLKGLPLPFKIGVETDMKDTKTHKVYVQGPSVILPDASYYKPEMAAQKDMILGIWTNIAKMILVFSDLSTEEQAIYLEDTLAFDAILGGLVKTSEEWSEYINVYNPYKTTTVTNFLRPVNFKHILKDLFDEVPETVIVSEPRFFRNFKSVLNVSSF